MTTLNCTIGTMLVAVCAGYSSPGITRIVYRHSTHNLRITPRPECHSATWYAEKHQFQVFACYDRNHHPLPRYATPCDFFTGDGYCDGCGYCCNLSEAATNPNCYPPPSKTR
jgi:hypothetical protein